ncbi:hypothetical protein BO78DRAFT_37694 [Aspergillus sclerotiicarbonarius CBS 121057]|uniref:Uncharacterized protein n=1 Tax=Aspergillus sclerotiicarbonarius (strain CBS 121057 / IBT 28362) TaxID=1448318 RepID=A0A319DWS2_ASPSB|nr:hypothetical protein BO78DRAFT_37694 [Aspergillus sclerotiicarbonarius CBS 121057]
MQKLKRYKILYPVGFAIITIGFCILFLLEQTSSAAEWAIKASGLGLIIGTSLPAAQAKLSDNSPGHGVWQFFHGFGMEFGSAIPLLCSAALHSLRSGDRSHTATWAQLSHGQPYEHGTKAFRLSVPIPIGPCAGHRRFTEALKRSWQVGPGRGLRDGCAETADVIKQGIARLGNEVGNSLSPGTGATW